ncbi:dicarboxylate transporter/tellurite-resistance protein TehA [Methylobacterium sp. Leaf86]|uniref:dicarboxylate transporter/tellurite-resistance protein TehA n=1 Tax=Methylobacterium sp. Leaf86 TaxID=1736242 RepID=UPI00329921E6
MEDSATVAEFAPGQLLLLGRGTAQALSDMPARPMPFLSVDTPYHTSTDKIFMDPRDGTAGNLPGAQCCGRLIRITGKRREMMGSSANVAAISVGAASPAPTIPTSFFGMVLGLAGLGSSWRAAHEAWGLPSAIGEGLMALAAFVWASLLILYVRKWLVDPPAASAELEHPVQCCFVGLIGVSTMLIAGGALPYSRAIAEVLFAAGALFTLAFAIWRTGGLWHGGRDAGTSTPVLYLPTVAGSFVTGIVAGALGWADWGQLAFGAGLFSWLAIESVLIHRLLTAPALAAALKPTLGIQLAPAPVAALSYLSVTAGSPDIVVHALLGYGLLQGLVLVRLSRWIWTGAFTPGYWAFTFGATALGTVPLRLLQRGDGNAVATLAPLLFVIANLVVIAVAIATLRLALRNELLPKPVVQAS